MWKNVLNFNFAKWKTQKMEKCVQKVRRKWDLACSGQTMRTHFFSTRKPGSSAASLCSLVHKPSFLCQVNLVLLLSFCTYVFYFLFTLFFFFLYFSLSLLKSLSLSLSPLIFLHIQSLLLTHLSFSLFIDI